MINLGPFQGPTAILYMKKMAQNSSKQFPNAYCTIFHSNINFGMEYDNINQSINKLSIKGLLEAFLKTPIKSVRFYGN